MDFEVQHREGRMIATGDMTIYNALTMKAALLDAWPSSHMDIVLDLAAVAELDTCGLQLLLMLQHRARQEGRRIRIVEASAPAREVLDLCGLEALYLTEAS